MLLIFIRRQSQYCMQIFSLVKWLLSFHTSTRTGPLNVYGPPPPMAHTDSVLGHWILFGAPTGGAKCPKTGSDLGGRPSTRRQSTRFTLSKVLAMLLLVLGVRIRRWSVGLGSGLGRRGPPGTTGAASESEK